MKLTQSNLFLISAVLSITLNSCASDGVSRNGSGSEETYYGAVINTEDILEAATIRGKLIHEDHVSVKMEGHVIATCGKKGCWMDVVSGEDTVFVKFKDYSFFVPTEGVEGYRTVMEGVAYYDTTTVSELRHFAEDAGKSKEEIALITEPEYRLQFTATGVMMEGI
jgi:hypothetical protein